jgi:hypothetical protein
MACINANTGSHGTRALDANSLMEGRGFNPAVTAHSLQGFQPLKPFFVLPSS